LVAWETTRAQLEGFLSVTEAELDERWLQNERRRRGQLLHSQYSQLLEDPDTVEAARLPLLPSYEALMSLPSMRALLAVDDIEASYRPDPVLLDEAAAIRRDFALAVQDVKMATFRKIIASIERAEKEQPANDPPSDLPFSLPGLSSPAPPTSAVPKPANGSDYTSEEVDAFLLRAVAIVRCNHCEQTDILPRLFNHPSCNNGGWPVHSYLYGGARAPKIPHPSIEPGTYFVPTGISRAALETIKLAKKPVNVSAEEMDAFGHAFTCTICKTSHGLPWHHFVSLYPPLLSHFCPHRSLTH
jgi:hypothetical protein